MARYGGDYGFRNGGDWTDRFHGSPRGSGRSGQEGWDRSPGGWSRPGFNVSLGSFGGRAPDRGYGFDNWGAYDTTGQGSPRSAGWSREASGGGHGSDADRVRARDLMTEDPHVITSDASLAEAARLMRDLDIGILPVVADRNDQQLQGVITDRDIAIRAAADGQDMTSARVGSFMSRGVESVREGDTVRDVFRVMKRDKVRRVPVVDEGGRLVGIIAQADLAVNYAGLDDEREMEVEEVIERISERGNPGHEATRWYGPSGERLYFGDGGSGREDRYGYDRDIGDRVRHGWRSLKRGARDLIRRGYDQAYDRGWR
jgi:CBS domain-containing protein